MTVVVVMVLKNGGGEKGNHNHPSPSFKSRTMGNAISSAIKYIRPEDGRIVVRVKSLGNWQAENGYHVQSRCRNNIRGVSHTKGVGV